MPPRRKKRRQIYYRASSTSSRSSTNSVAPASSSTPTENATPSPSPSPPPPPPPPPPPVNGRARRPLARASALIAQENHQLASALKEIFSNSQHVQNTESSLARLKKLYESTELRHFQEPLGDCLRTLLQSKPSIYFKTCCEFVCKFLEDLSALSENSGMPVTDNDRLINYCVDIAVQYMQVFDEECRRNAVFFVWKFVTHVESLDETICSALLSVLPKRIRDRKPIIRAHAVFASRIFQDNKMIQQAFLYHFERDPDLIVRKALMQIMDAKVFGYGFLIESTQDVHEMMRQSAFTRLSKVEPTELSTQQLHQVIRNGLNERHPKAAYAFKSITLKFWLPTMYVGTDIRKLLDSLNVLENREDVCRLLEFIYQKDLEQLENNAATTKLHLVVETFRSTWLSSVGLPTVDQIDEKITTIWLSLVRFCRSNQSQIKPIKIRTLHGPAASLEEIIDSQDRDDEMIVDLYERLTPDLVNLVRFLSDLVKHSYELIKTDPSQTEKMEFAYQELLQFITTYEIGDELERKVVHETLSQILRENLLTDKFKNFIPPIVKALFTLVYSSSSNLMINFISEMINDVRSHLEDIGEHQEIFKEHPAELLKCLQLYYGCLQSAKVTRLPETMQTHLMHLSYECLCEWNRENSKIRSLMVACNGISVLIDKNFAQKTTTLTLLVGACLDKSIEVRTVGYKFLVDNICHHEDIEVPNRLEEFLTINLREYGRYDPDNMSRSEYELLTVLIEGTAKLFYFKKICLPKILAHLIIWWYHPRTHSRLKQFIGVFLPMFVNDSLGKQETADDGWLKGLLVDTFVLSIQLLHDYILGPGDNLMAASDLHSLISYLSNLTPVAYHPAVMGKVDDCICDFAESKPDLAKYMKLSKNSLATVAASNTTVMSNITNSAV